MRARESLLMGYPDQLLAAAGRIRHTLEVAAASWLLDREYRCCYRGVLAMGTSSAQLALYAIQQDHRKKIITLWIGIQEAE